MIKFLTVCLGSICRIPAAKGILCDQLTKAGSVEGIDFEIDSAGIGLDTKAEVALFDIVEVNDPYYSASDGFQIMYQ